MNQVGIIGAGTMGRGIAQVAATAGWEVFLYDHNNDALNSGLQFIQKILSRSVEKQRLSAQEAKAIFGRIYPVDKFESFQSCDLVIEAIVENLDIKKQVFQAVEAIVSDTSILASNTSSLSITSIAACLEKQDRCIGIHFFNPAPLMKLVEIIPALQTSQNVTEQSRTWIEGWGKMTVLAKDTPGFIVNKVARPFYSEAIRMLEEGVASHGQIDSAVKQLGFRMGPFELMDLIGHDVNYKVTESVWHAFYLDGRYKPSFTQKRLVEAGYLGKKSGRGFYTYPRVEDKSLQELGNIALVSEIQDRMVTMLINEAADTVQQGIATAKDIDIAMQNGVNYPKGLLAWAHEIGLHTCVERLDALYEVYREERYRCAPILRRLAKRGEQFKI